MPYVEVESGIQIYFEEQGEGGRYILSSRSRIEHVNTYTMALAHMGYHLVEIQLRGYGKSTHIKDGYQSGWYDVWAADIVRIADYLNIPSFVYTGISHGAGVGWHILRSHEQRVLAFAGVVCGPHLRDGESMGRERRRTLEAASDEVRWADNCYRRFKNDCADALAGMNRDEKRMFCESAAEKLKETLDMKMEERLISPGKPFPDISTEEELVCELSKIKTPCLFLGGMKDPISPPQCLVRDGKAVAGSKTVLYEDSAHGLARRYPGQVAGEIDLFLRERHIFDRPETVDGSTEEDGV